MQSSFTPPLLAVLFLASVLPAARAADAAAQPIVLEAENLPTTGSGQAIIPARDTDASGDGWMKINTTAPGQWVEFTTPSIPAGTYLFQFHYRTNPTRAFHDIKIDGVQISGIVDQYATAPSTFPSADVGTVTFKSNGAHVIRLTALGKNLSSIDYVISADAFVFLPQASGGQTAAPTFNSAGGNYTEALEVTISSATRDAGIRYTTDGSMPTSSSTLYTAPVQIKATTTLKARAFKSGMADSDPFADTYTLTSSLLTLEAESLTTAKSGLTIMPVKDDEAASHGKWMKMNSTAPGQWVEFTTPSIPAGTYQIHLRYRTNPSRGQDEAMLDGKPVGGRIDQYSPSPSFYAAADLGVAIFKAPGPHVIRLTAVGKNAGSSNYDMSADAFLFSQQ